jgi:hypothetical protein
VVPGIPGLLRKPHRARRLLAAVRVLGSIGELALRRGSVPHHPARGRRSPVGLRHRPATTDPPLERTCTRRAGRTVHGQRARWMDPRGRVRWRAGRGRRDRRLDHCRQRPDAAPDRASGRVLAAREPRRSDHVKRPRSVRRGRCMPSASRSAVQRIARHTQPGRPRTTLLLPNPTKQRSSSCKEDAWQHSSLQ